MFCCEPAELHDGALLFSFEEGDDSRLTKTRDGDGTSAVQAPHIYDQVRIDQPDKPSHLPQSDAEGIPGQSPEPAVAEVAAADTAPSADEAPSAQSSQTSERPQITYSYGSHPVFGSLSRADLELTKVTSRDGPCAVLRLHPQIRIARDRHSSGWGLAV